MYDLYKPEKPAGLMDFVKAAKSCIKEVTPADLEKMQQEKPDLMLLDVRESAEHQETGHIKHATFVPRGILEAAADPSYPKRLQELVDARERPVVCYCATGGRSAMAAAVLQMMGFKEVYSLAGGFGGWVDAGKPVAREASY
ncbi:rhodanese-like domain-containing protein [Acidihalobacter ferrooxydans]|uniref:Sulfurtransferase n=1 Tax=Acidihalobacter ferrooxydans TaxID=1765967 RepID=A0A1P8UJA2_9GAMM|nr:rhodanese-like domain-containing protein [Acidihalobacter ferrooxydans]APZ43929.1 sulfurtransferase [Acidihalobacter ferrooxydans]